MPLRSLWREPLSRIKTGTYTGDGAASQAITGVGFRPKVVIILQQFDDTGLPMGFKTDQDGPYAQAINPGRAALDYEEDHIISLDSDGFTVGDGTGTSSGNSFNYNGRGYSFICLG